MSPFISKETLKFSNKRRTQEYQKGEAVRPRKTFKYDSAILHQEKIHRYAFKQLIAQSSSKFKNNVKQFQLKQQMLYQNLLIQQYLATTQRFFNVQDEPSFRCAIRLIKKLFKR